MLYSYFGSYCNGSAAWLCSVSGYLEMASNPLVESCAVICLCPYLKSVCDLCLLLPSAVYFLAHSRVLLNGAESCRVRAWRLETAAVQGNPYAKQRQESLQLRVGANLLILLGSLLLGKHTSTEVRNLVLLALHKITLTFF